MTIKKLAELAGVSAGTVDRALNNRGRINPEVAQRIQHIAREYGYKPNSVAKSLKIRNKGFRIAFIFHVMDNLYIRELSRGIRRAADEIADAGFSVHLKPCRDFDAAFQLRLIDESLEEGMQAIIISPISDPGISARLNELATRSFPVVFVNSVLENTEFLAYHGINFTQAGAIASRLIGMTTGGKANLAVFPPQFQMYGHVERVNAIRSHLADNFPGIRIVDITEIPNDEQLAGETVRRVLAKHPEIDAVLYSTGAIESGLFPMFDAIRSGRCLRLITVDTYGSVVQGLMEGHILATLSQESHEVGYKSVKCLFEAVTTKSPPAHKYNYVRVQVLLKEHLS